MAPIVQAPMTERMFDREADAAFTCGVFDMLHQGHVDLFDFMRFRAKDIYAIVHDDLSTFKNKKRFPVQPLELRLKNVKHFVTAAGETTEADPSATISAFISVMRKRVPGIKLVYVRGDDWIRFPGWETIAALDVDIVFKPYTPGISSSLRREEIKER